MKRLSKAQFLKYPYTISLVVSAIALLMAAGAYIRVATFQTVPVIPPEEPTAEQAVMPEEVVAKVVYHADYSDPRRLSAMLTSINNMVTTYQNDLRDYDVRIVFVSHGIRFVTQDKLQGTPFAEDEKLAARKQELIARIKSLNQVQGVKLELCGITREQIGLDQSALIEGVELVRSGVVRLAELQDQGFAYIKIE